MDDIRITQTGGIRQAHRGIPVVLILLGVAVLALSAWYILSFSSTNFQGSFPRTTPIVTNT